VISSVTIEAINHGWKSSASTTASSGLCRDISHVKTLTIDDVNRIQLRGGSILRTSRTNPAKSEADMRNGLDSLQKLGVASLVTIGGDDTAFSGKPGLPARPRRRPRRPRAEGPSTTTCRCRRRADLRL